MILAILGLFIKGLPGPILGYLEKRAASQNEALRTQAHEEIERRKLQRDVLMKEGDHWLAWLPRFLIAFPVALYIAAIYAVSIFQIPWTVLRVPSSMEEIMWIVVGALFLEKVTRIAKR